MAVGRGREEKLENNGMRDWKKERRKDVACGMMSDRKIERDRKRRERVRQS